jgi:hypothetical protein
MAHLACWPNRPAGPTGPPGSAKPAGSGLGRSNRPSPAPVASSLSLVVPLATCIAAAAAAWRFRPTPVTLAVATLGKILAAVPSSTSTKWFRWPTPLRGDPWLDPAQDFIPSATTELQSSPASLSNANDATPRESWCDCTPVEAPDAVLPVVPQ